MLEDSKLVELHYQKSNNNFIVGDIFLGHIKKLMPGLNAAFVDIGHKRDAFLHYTDMGPKLKSILSFTQLSINGKLGNGMLDNFTIESDINKNGKINDVLGKREPILVQVLKEPISTKGPRLSCEITLPGRYLVLTPFSNVVAVSKKIANNDERKRLNVLVESIRPKNFGVIVRTAAEGKKVADLHEEMQQLINKWKSIYDQLFHARPPVKLLSELDKTSSILRDLLNDDFNRVVVNDAELLTSIRSYLENISPDKVKIAQLHRSRKHIFDTYGINRQIKASFGKTATMSSGAYLVIEHTEAMHVIDVNSGPKMQKKDQDSSALAVNLEAAEEIARQMRLRDIGGIIIIDYIDMRRQEHKAQLHEKMREFMRNDRAQHTILPLSKFGLMQITRQRVRPEVNINTSEVCPSCGGTGKVNATILIIDDLERDLEYIISSRPKAKLQLHVHPYIHAYLTNGFPSRRMRWYMSFQKWVRIIPNGDLELTKYVFYDAKGDEIRLT